MNKKQKVRKSNTFISFITINYLFHLLYLSLLRNENYLITIVQYILHSWGTNIAQLCNINPTAVSKLILLHKSIKGTA